MTLTMHIVFAAAVTKPLLETHNPILVFAVAFASHFVMDAIPHSEYNLQSVKDLEIIKDYKKIAVDLFHISIDVLVGSTIFFITNLLIGNPFTMLMFLLVALGAIMPDALQVVYWVFKDSPIRHLQNFHQFIHVSTRIKSPIIGIGSQVVLIALSICLIIYL